MNESKKKDRYEDAKKVCKIFRWCEKMYSMGMTKNFKKWLRMPRLVIKLVSLYLLIQKYWISILQTFHITDSEFYK